MLMICFGVIIVLGFAAMCADVNRGAGEMKFCYDCKQTLPRSAFFRLTRSKDGPTEPGAKSAGIKSTAK